MPELVQVSFREKVAWLHLNRPRELNALSRALVADLDEALDEVAVSEARALVITGRGRAFCAGGDLGEFLSALEESEAALLQQLRENQVVLQRLADFEMPTFAAINGICIAGGLELALTCDFILASQDATIADGHARYGVQPGGGGTSRLARRISTSHAKWMMYSGATIPIETLLEWGLLNDILEPTSFENEAQAKAEKVTRHSPLLLRNMKKLIENNCDMPIENGNQAELDVFLTYSQSHDLREGLSAFRQKRLPEFKGT